jgi:AmiR/NasT family two-component response regulator
VEHEREPKIRVLVAEDDYLVLMGLRLSLQKLGYEVVAEATDGIQAVEQALEKKPDLILIDINMPYLDGIEALKKINEHHMAASIIVTGYSESKLVKRALEAGVFGYLVKPVDIRELAPAIDVALNRFEEFQKLTEDLHDAKAALEARKFIEKAKGILMENHHFTESEAMSYLQKKSRTKNKKITIIAREIIKADQILKE